MKRRLSWDDKYGWCNVDDDDETFLLVEWLNDSIEECRFLIILLLCIVVVVARLVWLSIVFPIDIIGQLFGIVLHNTFIMDFWLNGHVVSIDIYCLIYDFLI